MFFPLVYIGVSAKKILMQSVMGDFACSISSTFTLLLYYYCLIVIFSIVSTINFKQFIKDVLGKGEKTNWVIVVQIHYL